MAFVKVKNIPDGQIVEFASATITDPNTGESRGRAGFTGTATSNIVRFPDGKLRRLFVDVDPALSGGFNALWVELEEDLAEALFAFVATDPSTINVSDFDPQDFMDMVVVEEESQMLNPLRGFAPDILPRIASWLANELALPAAPLAKKVMGEWVVKERGGRSRVVLLEMSAEVGHVVYCLLRRAPGGLCKAVIIEDADWLETMRYWWRDDNNPPQEVGKMVVSLVRQDGIWGVL